MALPAAQVAAGTVAIQIKLGTDQTLSDGSNFSTSAQAAAAAWNAVLGDLQITSSIAAPDPAALPGKAATQGNGINELVFDTKEFDQTFDDNTLAVTTVWSVGDQRTQADIVFNKAYTWDSYRGHCATPSTCNAWPSTKWVTCSAWTTPMKPASPSRRPSRS